MKKIVVLYINHESDSPMGSSYSLLNLIESVSNEIHPIVLFPKEAACVDFFRANKIECIIIPFKLDIIGKCSIVKRIGSFPFRFIRDYFYNKRAVKKIVAISADRKIDIVHSNSSVIDFGPLLAKKLNARHVWHLREFLNLIGFKPFLGRRRLEKMISQSDAVVSITEGVHKHFNCNKAANQYIIPDAVRSKTDAFIGKKKENFFLICGLIGIVKGQEFAIKCFNEFVVTHPDYRLKIVGKGEQKYVEYLKSIAHSNVDFEGYQAEMSKYYKPATAYLMCTENEGLGRTTIEAMFYGCPVIGYNAGGTAEIITHNANGFLYENKHECILHMNTVVRQPDFSFVITKQAQLDAINKYSNEVYGLKIMEMYKSIL